MITDDIDYFLEEVFPNITKDEADLIEQVLLWDNEKQVAYRMAKRIFEEKDDGMG